MRRLQSGSSRTAAAAGPKRKRYCPFQPMRAPRKNNMDRIDKKRINVVCRLMRMIFVDRV
jgi:hypothetical protein